MLYFIPDRYVGWSCPACSDMQGGLGGVQISTWPSGPYPHREGIVRKAGYQVVVIAVWSCFRVIEWIGGWNLYEGVGFSFCLGHPPYKGGNGRGI